MKRNSKTEREKALRKLSKRSSELWQIVRELEWVPVEEPQFLGWEVQVILGDSGLRRGDASNILKVMEIFGMGKITFTRYEWVTKMIRNNNARYAETLKQVLKVVDKKHYWSLYSDPYNQVNMYYMPYFESRRITQQVYDTVPTYLHKYFTRHTERATVWRPEYYYYKLSAAFPRYELRLKVTKAYSTHRGIPNGEAQSEHKIIRDTLDQEHYWGSSSSYNRWYHKRTNRNQRKAWNMVTREVSKGVKNMSIAFFDECDILERVEEAEFYAIGRLARD